jgi:hypothetical protein
MVRAGWVAAPEFDCPFGFTLENLPKPLTREDKAEMEAQGRAAWEWLDTEAGKGALTMERLAGEFRAMIPRYGCRCLREWDGILESIPFRPADQVQWAIDVHNAVNAKLGKPVWPYGVDKDE